MITDISIQYKGKIEADWKLYKCISVHEGETGASEVGLLEQAFGNYYDFRVMIRIVRPVALEIYDRRTSNWVKFPRPEDK